MATAALIKSGQLGSAHSHGDLQDLEIIEDKSGGSRRKGGHVARYAKGRFLGKGGFAKCYEVTDIETKEVFAAKIVAKASVAKPRAHAKLRSEIAIHRSLDHDKVVKFYDYFEDCDNVYIILELCPSQTLNEFMRRRPNKRLSEPEAMFYAYDLILALKYLHRRQVLHRDLKLGNLFLDADVRLKVGDFGLAAQLEHDGEKKRTICGTPNYIAPEILEGKHGHSYEVDIWSFGVILYTMIIGRPPFETSDVKTTYKRIRSNQYGFPDTVRISQQAKDLITCILRTDPRARPSLDEILASSWFQSAQRLPPPVPAAVSAFTISPRVPHGSASARSDTPERGAADFARIDSPAPRFPLRDRMPSSVLQQNQQTQNLPRGNSAGPLLASCKPSTPPLGLLGTPGRYQQGGFPNGRPPLAARGNEENIMPMNNIGCSGSECGSFVPPLSPAPVHNYIGSGLTCRPQSAGVSGGRTSQGLAHSQQANPPLSSLRSNYSRDPSPILASSSNSTVANTGNALSAKVPSYQSSRSTVCSSPRTTPALSGRPATANVPSAKEPLSTRTLATSGSECGFTNKIFTKTSLASVRAGAVAPSSRTGFAEPPPFGSYQPPITPGAFEADGGSARTPFADRRPTSRNERSSSSPALLLDGLQREHSTPRGLAFPETLTVRKAPDSHRSEYVSRPCSAQTVRQEAEVFGHVPASGSRYSPTEEAQPALPELWVSKWVDYSSKYGVGYILADGSIGVYFNDSTKIVLVPDGNQFDYVTRRTQDRPEMRSTHTFEDHPEDLKKKVTLLRHFKNYMLMDIIEKKDGATAGESGLPMTLARLQMPYEPGQVPYVKKWTRNRHAIMFQLSNKTVQVVFFDKTEAVLSNRSRTVTYVDKRGHVSSYPLSNVLDVPNPELAKRLRYTKDILVNLLGGARAGDLGSAVGSAGDDAMPLTAALLSVR